MTRIVVLLLVCLVSPMAAAADGPVTPDTAFALASITKSFTAMGIMALVTDDERLADMRSHAE